MAVLVFLALNIKFDPPSGKRSLKSDLISSNLFLNSSDDKIADTTCSFDSVFESMLDLSCVSEYFKQRSVVFLLFDLHPFTTSVRDVMLTAWNVEKSNGFDGIDDAWGHSVGLCE